MMCRVGRVGWRGGEGMNKLMMWKEERGKFDVRGGEEKGTQRRDINDTLRTWVSISAL